MNDEQRERWIENLTALAKARKCRICGEPCERSQNWECGPLGYHHTECANRIAVLIKLDMLPEGHCD